MNIQKKTIKTGDSKTFPRKGQTVTVHYTGRLQNKKIFDSSEGKQPFSFVIGMGQVIRGWDEGVAKMSLGEEAILVISPEYGYGVRGAGNVIPPNSTLVFHIRLLEIN